MKKTILKGFSVVLAVALVLCLVITAFLVDRRITAQTQSAMINLTNALVQAYNTEKNPVQQAKALASGGENLRVTIIAADGTVLGDSVADETTMENHGRRAEILSAQNARIGIVTRKSETLGLMQMYAAVRLSDGNYLRIATEYGGLLSNVVGFLPALLAAALVAFLLSMGVATRFAASVAHPIAELCDSLKTVQDGGRALNPAAYPYEELQVMARDINQMAEEIQSHLGSIAQEKSKIDYILNNMREGFVLLDENQNILLINTAACAVFGCVAPMVRGKNLVHATRNVNVLGVVSTVLQEGGHTAVEMRDQTGQLYEINVSSVGEIETAAMERGAILLLSDITEKRGAAKMRQQFFESASHELKTPITSIKGFAELLCGDIALTAQQQKDISSRILKETTRMNSLIGDIIMISRLENGEVLFERELLDLGKVVEEACVDFQVAATQNDITLQWTTQQTVVSASQREMNELVGNLLSNAIRYNIPKGKVEVRLATENGAPTLTVFNTGEPIPQKYVQRVFERFFRLDKGRSKASGGTGLGLAIVKHIASGYHAQLKLIPQENGNTFVVTFPPQATL